MDVMKFFKMHQKFVNNAIGRSVVNIGEEDTISNTNFTVIPALNILIIVLNQNKLSFFEF